KIGTRSVEVPLAIVINEHMTINSSTEISCLLHERSKWTRTFIHVVTMPTWGRVHVKFSVPVGNFRCISGLRTRLFGHKSCVLPVDKILRSPCLYTTLVIHRTYIQII